MVDIPQTSISENGGSAQGTVTRNTGSGTELIVNLSSSDTTEATVPTQVTIPVGVSAVPFTVTAQNDTPVDGAQTVTITASAAGYASISDTLQVLDDDGGGGGGGGQTDDHGNSSATSTAVLVPSGTAGNIETQPDSDWFRFSAIGGTTYTLQTSLGTLRDSFLELFGTDGSTRLAQNDDIGGGNLASRIVWAAPATGTYYAKVTSYSQSYTGTYTFSVATGGSADAGSAAEMQANLDALFAAYAAGGADEKVIEAVAQAVAGT
jgi:hypothetical protein